jgi:hypothetical protein
LGFTPGGVFLIIWLFGWLFYCYGTGPKLDSPNALKEMELFTTVFANFAVQVVLAALFRV